MTDTVGCFSSHITVVAVFRGFRSFTMSQEYFMSELLIVSRSPEFFLTEPVRRAECDGFSLYQVFYSISRLLFQRVVTSMISLFSDSSFLSIFSCFCLALNTAYAVVLWWKKAATRLTQPSKRLSLLSDRPAWPSSKCGQSTATSMLTSRLLLLIWCLCLRGSEALALLWRCSADVFWLQRIYHLLKAFFFSTTENGLMSFAMKTDLVISLALARVRRRRISNLTGSVLCLFKLFFWAVPGGVDWSSSLSLWCRVKCCKMLLVFDE